jgi:anti-sigma B factor antagonist
MSQAQLQLTVRDAGARTAIIDVRGDFTATAEAELMAAFTAAGDGGAHAIIFNFADLEYMNSSGIGLLITVLIRANRQGQRILACGLSEHYRHIFALTRLDEAIGIHQDEASALAAVMAA